jgi:hypothetical protein
MACLDHEASASKAAALKLGVPITMLAATIRKRCHEYVEQRADRQN